MTRKLARLLLLLTVVLSGALTVKVDSTQAAASVSGCPTLPADNVWNTRVDNLPVHAQSDAYLGSMGMNTGLHADFGSGLWAGGPIGIPWTTVAGTQPRVPVSFGYASESDPGPYPIPTNAPIEGGSGSSGDRHVLVVDRDSCVLYELYSAYPQADGSWQAGSGAVYPLNSNTLRPAGWTSADAAGLPIFPGLVRYDEAAAGQIAHAIRFTAQVTQQRYDWPARHYASNNTSPNVPPMGTRVRLKANYDISGFSPRNRVILQAMKTYGMILADNGSNWYVSGEPDSRWDNNELHALGAVIGGAFEVVDESSLMVNVNSGQAGPGAPVGTATTAPAATVTATPTATSPATATRTRTATPTRTTVPTAAASSTTTRTSTSTSTVTLTATTTLTVTRTATGSPVSTATRTPTPTATDTATVTSTVTATSTPTASATVTPTSTATSTPTATSTSTSTSTPTSTATSAATLTPSPTLVSTSSPTASATRTSSAVPTATRTPEPSASPTAPIASPTPSATPLSPSRTPTLTASATHPPTASPSATLAVSEATATRTPSPTTIPPIATASATAASISMLVLQGSGELADTWISPDYPNQTFGSVVAAHLQGRYTPDRLLFDPDLASLPQGAVVQHATLQVYAYSANSTGNTAAAYALVTPWSADTATYDTPWHEPGLAAGLDYGASAVGSAQVGGVGWMTLDVTDAVRAWSQGTTNEGLMVRLSSGAPNAHYRVYLAESGRASVRPKLTIYYSE